ncbi:hypothetical protein B0H13DRAFT_2371253 [Mycena leptocephala]|nr:hypothetical protein B0H13DRAFT_2371253 [Mycena leptocephala]
MTMPLRQELNQVFGVFSAALLPRRNHLVAHPSIALPGPDPHYELHRGDNCHVLDSLGACRNFRQLSAAEVHSMANILGLRFLHTHLSIGCERYNQSCDSEQGAPPLFPSARSLRSILAYAIAGHLQSSTTKELEVHFLSSLEHNPLPFKLSHTGMFSKISVVVPYVLITLAAATPTGTPPPPITPRPLRNAATALFLPPAWTLPASPLS